MAVGGAGRGGSRRPEPSTVERGGRFEDRACAFLERAGLVVVERNFRCRAGEIDVVARDGDELVFVEVRSRADASSGRAEETVTAAKQRRVARVAEIYLAARRPEFSTCRFDVIGITGGEIVHVVDAFRVGL